MTASGILVLNKPAGMTSRRAVDLVQRIVRPAKVGHAGTLDPLASGVLVACVGPTTRLIEYIQRMPKAYRGTFLLGRRSDSEDTECEVEVLDDAPIPTRESLDEAAVGLTGDILQRPPAFSALKIDGKRAYHLARKGKEVELAARPITIHRLTVARYDYAEIELDVECGSGTYIRSLGRDLAEAVGTAAVMTDLVRTAIGSFTLESAVDPNDLNADNWREHLLPAARGVEGMPIVRVTEDEAQGLLDGRIVDPTTPPDETSSETEEWAAIAPTGRLVGILTPRGGGRFAPKRCFPPG